MVLASWTAPGRWPTLSFCSSSAEGKGEMRGSEVSMIFFNSHDPSTKVPSCLMQPLKPAIFIPSFLVPGC